MQQLEAHEVPLYKVFSGEYDFRIPDYQRPYAWEVEQATQLLDDLAEALDRGDEEPYFLGSIVLVKAKDTAQSDVIDGQQRLTTLTILIAVLRDLTDDPTLRGELDALLQEPGSIVQGLDKKPRLTLRKRDAPFFRTFVQETSSLSALEQLDTLQLETSAQKAIQANAAALRERLSSWDELRRLQLAKMLGGRTYLVAVSTPDLDSAHRIFSVMNARGLDLSPADIFKATVIGKVPLDKSAFYTDRWETAEESLGRDEFAELFLHIRTIVSKERGRRELLKEFPEQVLDAYFPSQATQFVDELLVPYADAYAALNGDSYAATTDADYVNAWLRRLSQLDNNDWKPAALWAMRHHGNDPAWLCEFLGSLERLAVSMLICRWYTTPRINRYLELLRQLEQGDGIEALALRLTEDERNDTLARLGGQIYLVQRVRKYVLLRLDETLANQPGVTYSHPLITIEHVLPQSPEADSVWCRLFTEEEREHWTHRLANLVLLNRPKNSEAGRKDFAQKKSGYFTSPKGVAAFALTTQVLACDEWTPAVLTERQAELIETLRALWRL